MTRPTSNPERLMTHAGRKYARRLRKYTRRIRKDAKLVRKLQKQLGKLSKASFGPHWRWINKRFRHGIWTMQELLSACDIIKKLPNFNLRASSIKKAHLLEMVANYHQFKANAWSDWVDGKLKELGTQEEAIRDDQEDNTPANADALRSPSVDDEIVEDDLVDEENDHHGEIAGPKNFLGLINGDTGREDPLRMNPGTGVQQTHLQFPDGERLFPEFLVCPSTQVRANLEAPAIAFVIAAMISQLPASIPSNLRRTIIENIKKTDIRLKPSGLPFMDRIKKATKTNEDKVALTDVVQGLAHAHWKVGKTGAYGFFYNSLRALSIEKVADYGFDWSNIQGTNVHDSEGNGLRICTYAPAPRRKVADNHRKRFEESDVGKKLLADTSFTFGGCGENGTYVYTTHDVVFKGTQHQLDELLGHQASLFDDRYRIRANAQHDVASDAPAVASDDTPDDGWVL